MDETHIGAVILALRKQQGMTQEQLAEAVGVSPPAVSKWETGSSCPDVALLSPIARALDTDVNTLLSFAPTLSQEELLAASDAPDAPRALDAYGAVAEALGYPPCLLDLQLAARAMEDHDPEGALEKLRAVARELKGETEQAIPCGALLPRAAAPITAPWAGCCKTACGQTPSSSRCGRIPGLKRFSGSWTLNCKKRPGAYRAGSLFSDIT